MFFEESQYRVKHIFSCRNLFLVLCERYSSDTNTVEYYVGTREKKKVNRFLAYSLSELLQCLFTLLALVLMFFFLNYFANVFSSLALMGMALALSLSFLFVLYKFRNLYNIDNPKFKSQFNGMFLIQDVSDPVHKNFWRTRKWHKMLPGMKRTLIESYVALVNNYEILYDLGQKKENSDWLDMVDNLVSSKEAQWNIDDMEHNIDDMLNVQKYIKI